MNDLIDSYIATLTDFAKLNPSNPEAAIEMIANSLIAGEADDIIVSSKQSGAAFVNELMKRSRTCGVEREVAAFPLTSYIERFGVTEDLKLQDFPEFLEHARKISAYSK